MTRKIQVGGVTIGGGAPVVIQSMLNTKTTDVEGSLNQIKALQTRSDFLLRRIKQLEQQPETGGETLWI